MSLINVSNLTFAYDGSYDNVFENVSFQIDTDWKLGFVGRNGRGKTTFLNLLLGKYKYSGTISSSVDFEYFPYEVKDINELTRDITERICPDCEEWEIFREIGLLKVPEDVMYRPFSTLSNGERTKVLLAALFLRTNSFLLIDEPTNHLDSEARKTVGEYLKRKKGFILVSHDRALLDNCVDHILSVNKADITVQSGTFSSWLRNKELQDNFETAQNEKLKKDIKRLSAAAKQRAAWSDKTESSKFGTKNSGSSIDRGFVGHKAAKMMKRSKVLEQRQQDAIDKKSELLKNIEYSENLKISPLVHPSGRLLELSDISIFYGEREVCKNISFEIKNGDRISLYGKNGCGKSSVLKLICGEPIKHSGELYKASRLKISYVSQDTSDLSGSLSDYAERYEIDESLFKTILRKLGFSREQFEKDISDYSGGQKKKVLIARSLSEKAHLYIWDEPLNFIDVISRMQIEKLLSEFKPTMLFVEHDEAFNENVEAVKIKIE